MLGIRVTSGRRTADSMPYDGCCPTSKVCVLVFFGRKGGSVTKGSADLARLGSLCVFFSFSKLLFEVVSSTAESTRDCC